MSRSAAAPFVVDASISAAWFLPDEATAQTEAALQATVECDVWVPALWLLEIGNLLLGAARRKRISSDQRRELAAAAGGLRLKIDREAVAIATLDEIAGRHGLTAYDAVYLELALRRRLPIVTCDKALLAAASAEGMALRIDTGSVKR